MTKVRRSCLGCRRSDRPISRLGPDGPGSICEVCYFKIAKRDALLFQQPNGDVSVTLKRGSKLVEVIGFERNGNTSRRDHAKPLVRSWQGAFWEKRPLYDGYHDYDHQNHEDSSIEVGNDDEYLTVESSGTSVDEPTIATKPYITSLPKHHVDEYVSMKVLFKNELRRTSIPFYFSFTELHFKLRRMFNLKIPKRFDISYIDEDDDEITLKSTEDLEELFRLVREKKLLKVRMKLTVQALVEEPIVIS